MVAMWYRIAGNFQGRINTFANFKGLCYLQKSSPQKSYFSPIHESFLSQKFPAIRTSKDFCQLVRLHMFVPTFDRMTILKSGYTPNSHPQCLCGQLTNLSHYIGHMIQQCSWKHAFSLLSADNVNLFLTHCEFWNLFVSSICHIFGQVAIIII